MYLMKEMKVNDEKVIIRKANKSDAKALIEYLNVIGEESDFLINGEFYDSLLMGLLID